MAKCLFKPFDFTIKQGDTESPFAVIYQNEDEEAIDITGYSARMQARADYDSESVMTLTEADGLVIDGASGKVSVNISEEVTAAIDAGVYVYDLEIIAPDGWTKTLLSGKMTVLAEVSRP